jgi:hypothetical protein
MKSDNTSAKKPNVMVSRYTDSLKKDMNRNYAAGEKFMSKSEGSIVTDASDKYNNKAGIEMYERGKKSEKLYNASKTKLPPNVPSPFKLAMKKTSEVVKKNKK